MKNRLLLVVLSLTVISGSAAFGQAQASAGYTPFMFSFVTPLQVPPRDFDVGGLRINLLYGECHDFLGFDVGAVGRATGDADGFQATLIANVVGGGGVGFQASTANCVFGDYAGLQIGAANYVKSVNGLQIGLLLNRADYVEGAQIGLINVTRQMIGVQLGLVNVIQDNDLKFLPIFNCSF
jgi:hypothetical protein